MKRVSVADIGGAELADTFPKEPERVYVLEVTFFGEYGWTSVHRTYEGAQRRLEEKVDAYNARAEYEAAQAGPAVSHSDTCHAVGEEGDDVVWGISCLTIEE